MLSNLIKKLLTCTGVCLISCQSINAQSDSLHLNLKNLFDLGVESNLQLAAMRLQEQIASEKASTARMAQYPDIEVGLKGGILGQPVVFERGLAHPTKPETPDWQQNYSIDFRQPIYEGGRIKYAIRKADIEK